MSENIGMLVNLDRCMGCYGCQTACRETNHYSYDEQWLEVIRRKPYYVDGELRNYHLLAPSLDKCSLCYGNNPDVLCASVCGAGALTVGPVDELINKAKESKTAQFSLQAVL